MKNWRLAFDLWLSGCGTGSGLASISRGALLQVYAAGRDCGLAEMLAEPEAVEPDPNPISGTDAGNPILRVRDLLEELEAVLTVEYHNKNWLALDNKKRAQEQRALVRECLGILPAPSTAVANFT